MNLIERLEGYDKAKLIVDNQINSEFQTEFFDINGNYYANDFGDLVIYRNNQWVDFDSKDPEFELFSITDLEAEVMQYRRQHNKYEVDDLVVFSNEKLMKPVLLKIKEFRHFNLVRLEVLDSGLCGPSYQTDIRHATDAEIEAGKRLELTNGKI